MEEEEDDDDDNRLAASLCFPFSCQREIQNRRLHPRLAGWLRRSAASRSCSRLASPALGRRAAMSCHSLQSLFLTQLIIHLDEGGRRDAPQADTPTPSCSGDRPAGWPRMRWPSSCGRAERYPFRHGLMAMFAGLHWSVNLVGVLNTPFSMGKGLSTAASSRCGPVGLGSRKPMSCSLIC